MAPACQFLVVIKPTKLYKTSEAAADKSKSDLQPGDVLLPSKAHEAEVMVVYDNCFLVERWACCNFTKRGVANDRIEVIFNTGENKWRVGWVEKDAVVMGEYNAVFDNVRCSDGGTVSQILAPSCYLNAAQALMAARQKSVDKNQGAQNAPAMSHDNGQAQASIGSDQGTGEAEYQQGLSYENRNDYAQAAVWYRKAAEQGNANAEYNLGWLYENGQGVPQDYAQAVAWYRKAAEQGNAHAENNLGGCYYDGQGVPQDYAQAAAWYRKAAEQGDAHAENSLGVCYHDGRGVPQDYAQAVAWFRKAAEHGNAYAELHLGWLYQNGQGVPQDGAQAAAWYRKAAEHGNQDAMSALAQLNRAEAAREAQAKAQAKAQALEKKLATSPYDERAIYGKASLPLQTRRKAVAESLLRAFMAGDFDVAESYMDCSFSGLDNLAGWWLNHGGGGVSYTKCQFLGTQQVTHDIMHIVDSGFALPGYWFLLTAKDGRQDEFVVIFDMLETNSPRQYDVPKVVGVMKLGTGVPAGCVRFW
jgi:TPR repeat protein